MAEQGLGVLVIGGDVIGAGTACEAAKDAVHEAARGLGQRVAEYVAPPPLTGADDPLRAEVAHAVPYEGARHLDDVLTTGPASPPRPQTAVRARPPT